MAPDESDELDSVSELIREFKQHSSEQAAQDIYDRYIGRLTRWAKHLLCHGPRRVADEEDVAAQAIAGVLEGIKKGRFLELDDRDDLWQVLLMLVNRRAADHLRKYAREASAGPAQSPVEDDSEASAREPPSIHQVADGEPTPEEVHELVETLRGRLRQLPSDRHRLIAVGKLEGRTDAAIAALLDCTTRTVQNALQAIRRAWETA